MTAIITVRLEEGTNVLFFIFLVKRFIRDYKIITSLGQEGVGLETGLSSFACTYHLEPKLPAFACCLFTMKKEFESVGAANVLKLK